MPTPWFDLNRAGHRPLPKQTRYRLTEEPVKSEADVLCSCCKARPWQHILILNATLAPLLCRGCRNMMVGAKVG